MMGSSSLLSSNSSFLSTPRNPKIGLSPSIYYYCKPKKDLVLLCTSPKGFQQSTQSTIQSKANRRGQSQNHTPIDIISRQVDRLTKETKPNGGKTHPGSGGGPSEVSQDRMMALLKRIHDDICKGPPSGSKASKPYFPKSNEPIQSFRGDPKQKYSPGNTPRYNSDRERSFKGAGDKEFSTKNVADMAASGDKLAKGPDISRGMHAPRPRMNLPRHGTNFSRPVSKFVRKSPMKQSPNPHRPVKLREEANRIDPVEEPENLAQLLNVMDLEKTLTEEATESDSEDQTSEAVEIAFEEQTSEVVESAFEDQTSEAIEIAFEDQASEAIETAFEDQPSEVATNTASEPQELDEMKLDELKELAKAKGLKGYSKMKKADLLELLKGV